MKQTEIEFTFSLLETTLPSYEELRAGFGNIGLSLAPAQSYQQHDRYFDDKKRLAAAGMALRQRVRNGQREATLKQVVQSAGARQDFGELSVPMPLTEKKWGQAIRTALRGIAFTSRLQVVMELNTHRIRYAIGRSGQPLASLCFDEVSATLPNHATSAHFMECELEFLAEQERYIDKWAEPIITVLQQLAPMNASSSHKLERAQTLLAHSQIMADLTDM